MVASRVIEKLAGQAELDGLELVEDVAEPYLRVPVERLRDLMRRLRDEPDLAFEQILAVTGVDCGDRIDVVYHLRSYSNPATLTVKVSAPREGGVVPSIADLFPAANWHERETYDMLGVRFEGHPNPRRILLPEDWDGHPLLKDYQQPEEYHGISHKWTEVRPITTDG